ncbi:MAG: GNAT family N-acetyltransferase, partial [Candidatus Acidiferrum sp.]
MGKSPEADWAVERLASRHDRTHFDCGQPALNDWIKLRAGQFERKDLARTFVAVYVEYPRVLGYYALAGHRVRFESLPEDQAKALPRIDVPVVL